MLSFGIQFGRGFDRTTIIKVMQSVPVDFDYDLLVVGSNPGGVACAREARLANKKTAIITWKRYSPAEAEGYDEDLREMEQALGLTPEVWPQASSILKATSSELKSSMKKPQTQYYSSKTQRWIRKSSVGGRKVRRSRLDLKNELFKRGQQCRRLMHNATFLGRVVEDARKCGWRLPGSSTTTLSINWHKLTEEIMDYVMKENSDLITMLNTEQVEVMEGFAVLQDSHTVKVIKPDKSETEVTAAIICLALPSECVIPHKVAGAREYGITADDFIRLDLPPGNTLIVGAVPESLECAGILAGCHLPVTVVTRSKILKGYDSEVTQMIINNMKDKGVNFMENTTLTSIEMTENGNLLAKFKTTKTAPEESKRETTSEEPSEVDFSENYDTVVFAVGRKVQLNVFTPAFELERDEGTQKILVDDADATSVPNIYAVGDGLANRPEGFAISELAGKLLGKRLFHGGSEIMDYTVTPNVMLTPTEYAFVGVSEDAAIDRLGFECVDVYYCQFKPLDFVIPAKEGIFFAKVVVLKLNDAVIGVHIFGPEAGEIIQGFAAAIRSGLTMTKFRTVVGVTATKAKEILNLELRSKKKQ